MSGSELSGASRAHAGPRTPALSGAWRAHARPRATPLFDANGLVVAGDARCATAAGIVAIVAGRLPDPDAAQALAAAYRRLGAAALDRLPGEWAALVWDPADGALVLASDPLGGRSLHWAASGHGVVFGEDARDVLELLPTTPAPARQAVCAWLAHAVLPEDGTLYAGVRRIPPGSALRLRGGARERLTIWRPAYRVPLAGPPDELAARLRDGIDAAVARAAAGSRAPGVLVSGGLDSAIVATALAERSPVAYSATFPGHPEADETAQLAALVSHLRLPSVRAVVASGRPVIGGLRYLAGWRLPSASPNGYIWRPLLAVAAADGSDAVLDGQGGDELFDSHPFYLLADLVARGRVRAAWDLTARYPGGGRRARSRLLARYARHGLAPPWLARRRRPPDATGLLESRDRRAASAVLDEWAWRSHDGPRWWARRLDTVTRLRQLLDMPGTLRRSAAVAGVAGRHPLLLDRELVELALQLPPEASFEGRLSRPLARRSQTRRLPDGIRLRAGKSHLSGVLQRTLHERDGQLLASLLGTPQARVREFVRAAALDDLVDGAPALTAVGSLWRVGAIECWLRQLEDASFAGELLARHEDETLDYRLVRDST